MPAPEEFARQEIVTRLTRCGWLIENFIAMEQIVDNKNDPGNGYDEA